MQYKDMKEMTIKEWDGRPFQAYFADNEYNEPVRPPDATITGWDNGQWLSHQGYRWLHVYPVEWNKPTPKRMTKRQLALWLAQGNGEWKLKGGTTVKTHFEYFDSARNEPVVLDVQVRLKDSEVWIEPTEDLLKGDN